jgi:hypothetical protein
MLPPNSQVVRSLSEVFGSICATTCQVRMRASAPVQAMGLSGDAAHDLATPILPFAVVAAQFTTAVDAPSVAAGEMLALTASFTPGVLPVLADAYIVLRTPDGAMLSLTLSGFVPGLVPFARNAPLSTALSLEVLRTVVPAGTPPGTYAWLSALTEPGTLNPLTAMTTTPFAVTP